MTVITCASTDFFLSLFKKDFKKSPEEYMYCVVYGSHYSWWLWLPHTHNALWCGCVMQMSNLKKVSLLSLNDSGFNDHLSRMVCSASVIARTFLYVQNYMLCWINVKSHMGVWQYIPRLSIPFAVSSKMKILQYMREKKIEARKWWWLMIVLLMSSCEAARQRITLETQRCC